MSNHLGTLRNKRLNSRKSFQREHLTSPAHKIKFLFAERVSGNISYQIIPKQWKPIKPHKVIAVICRIFAVTL